MTRYFAFLRAVNVGGHTVKMDHLRQLFIEQKLENVETFIASGNVIFETITSDLQTLEKQIEAGLLAGLGFETAAFVRDAEELAQIANYRPFSQAQIEAATAFNVAFLKEPAGEEITRKVAALQTDIDTFKVHGREIYWLCLKKQSESTFSNAVLERTTRQKSTLRGVSTVKKLMEKYLPV